VPAARLLLENDRPLNLGSRALDVLIALVERAGNTVSKPQLIAAAWPDRTRVVDEVALRVHVATLRKAIGDGRGGTRYIASVSGRGYAFVAPVERLHEDRPINSAGPVKFGGIPALATRVIGRDAVIQTLSIQAAHRPLVTIVGPPGIGKTTTALAVAETVRASYRDGVWFVALASVPKSELVPFYLGGILGISLPGADPISGVVAWLREKHTLIVVDNCEHVVDAVALLAEAIVKFAPRVRLLVTSREPLRIRGEWRHRLAPLEFPVAGIQATAREALGYPAVALFNERATGAADQFMITDDDVPALFEICRRLDGVPLALELAAARVEAFGVKGLAARLDDRLPLLIQEQRSAPPRQQTLRAALDWSHDLLSEEEQIILRRLSVFQGDFTLEAGAAIVADDELALEQVFFGVGNLVEKSLIMADITEDTAYYRLLEMTRAYALQKLSDSGEQSRIARRHAVYFLDLFSVPRAVTSAWSQADWRAAYGRDIGNLRAALHWAFAPCGNVALGVSLAAAAMEMWTALLLHNECCYWGIKAVASLGVALGTRDEMLLQCGLGYALTHSRGAPVEAQAALSRAFALAESMVDLEYQFRALFASWLFFLRRSELGVCLILCRQLERLTVATNDAAQRAVVDCIFGQTLYYIGEYEAALGKLERARGAFPMHMREGYRIRIGVDIVIAILCYQLMIFWALGWHDRAFRTGQDAMKEARKLGHPISLCIAMTASRCTTLVKMGYLKETEHEIDTFIEHTRRHSLTAHHSYGLCSKGCLEVAKGDFGEAERLLRFGLGRSQEVGNSLFYAFFQGELAAVLGATGRVSEGLTEIDAALCGAEESGSLWCMPELLRIKGELTRTEGYFVRSLNLAREQKALTWELRSATSLGRLWWERGKCADAIALVQNVYDKFVEGFDTIDLRAAREFLTQPLRIPCDPIEELVQG
jgi:predicted ATPase/DNA-binding winged helix-turn-helix (wHTH) protein